MVRAGSILLICALFAGCEERVVEFGSAPAAPWAGLPDAVRPGGTTGEPLRDGSGAARLAPAADIVSSGVIVCENPGDRVVKGPFEARQAPNPVNRDTWHGSGGVIVADFDDDGRLDIVAPAEPYAKLFTGTDDHLFDEDRVLLDYDLTYGIGGSVVDYDGDGDLDLFLLRLFQPNVLLRNRGDGSFDDVTESALPPERRFRGEYAPSMASSWADVDGDGDLDLFVGNYGRPDVDLSSTEVAWPSVLYLNRGDGTFDDVSATLPPQVHDGYTYVAGFHDIDGDMWPELYVVNDLGWLTPSLLLRNVEGELVPDDGVAGLDVTSSAAGLGVGDINGDGRPDFLLPEWNTIRLMESTDAGLYLDHGPARGIRPDASRDQQTGWGAELADLDNDGRLDAPIAYGHIGVSDPRRRNAVRQPDALYLQAEDGSFTDVAPEWGIDDSGSNRGFVLADFNDDGWLDVAKRDVDGPSQLYMSRCGSEAWLRVELRMPGANTRAVGARVVVEADGQRWERTVLAGGTGYGSGAPPEVHFGLGDVEWIDRITVLWPDRRANVFDDIEPRQGVRIRRVE
ncbi:MAG: hypothetical protein ACI8PZ_000319 [Myxococcota bacterium]|jgi:hypothetical protein